MYLLICLPQALASLFYHFALFCRVELQFLLLERLYKVHLLVLRVDLIEYFLIVAIESEVEQFLVEVEGRVAHDGLGGVKDLGVES